jgi:hypothetical protein
MYKEVFNLPLVFVVVIFSKVVKYILLLFALFVNILLQRKGIVSTKKMIRNLWFKMPKQRKKNVEKG